LTLLVLVARISTLARYVREKLPSTNVVLPALLPMGPRRGDATYPNKISKVQGSPGVSLLLFRVLPGLDKLSLGRRV
jgi:hypothetical protein